MLLEGAPEIMGNGGVDGASSSLLPTLLEPLLLGTLTCTLVRCVWSPGRTQDHLIIVLTKSNSDNFSEQSNPL